VDDPLPHVAGEGGAMNARELVHGGRVNLPVLSCAGCGKCCENQPSPPGYAFCFPPPGRLDAETLASADYRRVLRMPGDLREALSAYYARPDNDDDAPCLWLDVQTRQCRHYRWRPDCCREFRLGSAACRRMRAEAGLEKFVPSPITAGEGERTL
jgi:Fe-S-cluster containining protein